MRIENISREMYESRILPAWRNTDMHRPAEQRGEEALLFTLTKDPLSHWFYGPTEHTFIYVTAPGQFGSFHCTNAKGRAEWSDKKAFQRILKQIFTSLELTRLSAIVPAPLLKVRELVEHLGFLYEGRVRRAALFNEEPVDVVIYGMLATEVEKVSKRKRRRRSRRNDKTSFPLKVGSGDTPAKAEDLGGEEQKET